MPRYNIFFFCYVTDVAVCDMVLVCTELLFTVVVTSNMPVSCVVENECVFYVYRCSLETVFAEGALLWQSFNTDMRRITTFQSTTDRIYDGGPIGL